MFRHDIERVCISCRYFTDVMNMLQPVYVFIIFVMKRNVINMILGRDKKGRKSKSQTERFKIRGKHYQRNLQKQQSTETNTPTAMTRLSSKNEPPIEMQSLNQ